ncbi:porin [Tropicimonas isoalkanivorans]|uniref:Porin n=2 Tax=Tropicimonas isoalkanivorans TaxID=441112 RepID=A0A1I1EBV1_9RHOB|nr:porin [Tropicimonas isoalkanivorans]SFB84591.1 porin [Tropicimonas isoalkanivorans]
MYLGYDDDAKSYGNLTDNGNSNCRIGLTLMQPAGSGLTFGMVLEAALGGPQCSGFAQVSDPIWIWQKTDIRKAEISLGGHFGTLFLGQGSMATDSVAARDLSGTALAGYVNRPDTAGSYSLRRRDGDLSGFTIGDVFKDYNGSTRKQIRYDTPGWNGLSLRGA